MTELFSVEQSVRTVTTLSGDTPVMGCTRAALLTRAGDRWGAERKSLGFADGSNRRESGPANAGFKVARVTWNINRVGRAVRESATSHCAGCGKYMDGCDCDAAGRRDV